LLALASVSFAERRFFRDGQSSRPGQSGCIQAQVQLIQFERFKKNYSRAVGLESENESSLFGLGLRCASVAAPLAGMLQRQRPMIGATRPRPKIRAPHWL